MASRTFWDSTYRTFEPEPFRDEVLAAAARNALDFFGDVCGKKLLEIGCGPGEASLYFASRGASVTAIDTSAVAIERLQSSCKANGLPNVRALTCSAFDIAPIGPFHFIFGNMILHHLEPFDAFARLLAQCLEPGGRAFFCENSAANPLLMWSRKYLVGRAWIPKNSDDDESPLSPDEIDELRKHLQVDLQHPKLVMFEMFDSYVLRKRLPRVRKGLVALDEFLYRFPRLRRSSYLQEIYLTKN